MANPPLDIGRELGKILSGDGIERLLNELSDPGSEFTPGEAARIFGAMEAIGARGTEGVKDRLVGIKLHTEAEVLFKWRDPSVQVRVDNDQVKKLFPRRDYPDLYKEVEVRGGVTIELPFDKRDIAIPLEPTPAPAEAWDVSGFPPPEPFN